MHWPWSHLHRTLSGILPCEARTFLTRINTAAITCPAYISILIPGSKGLSPHELAHKWVKDFRTRHDMRILGRIVEVRSTKQSVGIKVRGFCPWHHLIMSPASFQESVSMADAWLISYQTLNRLPPINSRQMELLGTFSLSMPRKYSRNFRSRFAS